MPKTYYDSLCIRVLAAKVELEDRLGVLNIKEEEVREATISVNIALEHLYGLVDAACRSPTRSLWQAQFKASLAFATDTVEHVDVIGELISVRPMPWQRAFTQVVHRACSARTSNDDEAETAILAELRSAFPSPLPGLVSAH